jgi:hypothetical protein
MSVKRSKSRVAKTLTFGFSQKGKNARSNSPARATSQEPPVSGLKEDRSRIKITREGNELRTFTPARDAARQEAAQRAAAEHGLSTS